MKKVFALIMVLALVLSLVACGEDKELLEEQNEVESLLKGAWVGQSSINNELYYSFHFYNEGKYTYTNYLASEDVSVESEEGTFTIDAKDKTIICKCTKRHYIDGGVGEERYVHYKYDSGTLTISYLGTNLHK